MLAEPRSIFHYASFRGQGEVSLGKLYAKLRQREFPDRVKNA